MNNSRLEQLLKFREEDPNDPFIIYGLAMEYLKSDFNKGLELFKILLTDHPDYIATYYHAGKLMEKLGNKTEAERIYLLGIEKSKSANKLHSLSELRSAYNLLKDNEEDNE